MRDRTGWARGETGPVKIGTKSYKRLTEFSRKCAACEQPFSIYVTEKIAEGLADSNNFGLKNCETHRRGGISHSTEEVETLRSKDRVMADELEGLYATIRELQAKLAKYELPTAMAQFPWK
jgi:hypothetical protein